MTDEIRPELREQIKKMNERLVPRDPARIDYILAKLGDLWSIHPDMRLGQLISNLKGVGPQDVFHFEDDDLEDQLNKVLDNHGRFD